MINMQDVEVPENKNYPPALNKALSDPFNYSVGLKCGTIIDFESAEIINDNWVHLEKITRVLTGNSLEIQHENMFTLNYHFPRGMDVNVNNINWVADASRGS